MKNIPFVIPSDSEGIAQARRLRFLAFGPE
jgi:hypothetical protein